MHLHFLRILRKVVKSDLLLYQESIFLLNSLCPKCPIVRCFVGSLRVRLLFKYISQNAFYPVSLKCRIATMTKPGNLHCVTRSKTTGEHVKTRRNLSHLGSLDTLKFVY